MIIWLVGMLCVEQMSLEGWFREDILEKSCFIREVALEVP